MKALGNGSRSLLFFFVIERSVLMVLKEPSNSGIFLKLNAARVQLLEKLKLSAFQTCSQGLPSASAETCRFQMIQLLEFQEIWPKNSSETT